VLRIHRGLSRVQRIPSRFVLGGRALCPCLPAPACSTILIPPPPPFPASLQVRRELAPIVARNRRRADGASAYAAVAAQQRPAAAKAGKERLQVGTRAL
jgi:hypothetical protein